MFSDIHLWLNGDSVGLLLTPIQEASLHFFKKKIAVSRLKLKFKELKMTKLKVALCAAVTVLATQASAHGIEQTSRAVAIGSHASETISVSCHGNHKVTGGGYKLNSQRNPDGPIVVTASYPSSAGTWTVDVTNRSGRETVNNESVISVYAICSGVRHK